MRRMKLRRVGALSVAMWHSIYSLIFSLFLALAFTAYTYLMLGKVSSSYLIYYWVVIPVIYFPMGFVAYGLVALLYNSVASSFGAISMEFDSGENEQPPPPESYLS